MSVYMEILVTLQPITIKRVCRPVRRALNSPVFPLYRACSRRPGWGLLRFTYLSSHTCSSRVVLLPQLCVSSKVYLKLTVYFSASLSSLSSLGCNCTQLNPRLLNTSPSPPHHLSTCLKHIQKRISSALISAFLCRHSRCFRELAVSVRQLGPGGYFLEFVGSHDLWCQTLWSSSFYVFSQYNQGDLLVSTTCWWLPKKLDLSLFWWESSDVTLVVLTECSSSYPLSSTGQPESLPVAHKHDLTLLSSRTDDCSLFSLISRLVWWEQGGCRGSDLIWSDQFLTPLRGRVF